MSEIFYRLNLIFPVYIDFNSTFILNNKCFWIDTIFNYKHQTIGKESEIIS